MSSSFIVFNYSILGYIFVMLIVTSLFLTYYKNGAAVHKVLGLLLLSLFTTLLFMFKTQFLFVYIVYILAFIGAVLMLFLSVVLMLPISVINKSDNEGANSN